MPVTWAVAAMKASTLSKSDGPYNPVALAVANVYRFMDEYDRRPPQDRRHWNLATVERVNLDMLTSRLFGKLKFVDVARYSLELQMWYRDNKAGEDKYWFLTDTGPRYDHLRANTEETITIVKQIEAALGKLTDEECRLLGLSRR